MGTRLHLLLAALLAIGCLGANRAENLRAVVEQGNRAWVQASRSLDKTVLEPYFADDALATLADVLASSRQDRVYMDLELLKVEYRGIEIAPDGKHGSVTVSEYWRVTARRLDTGQCEVILKPRERRQTYRLTMTKAGWRIVGIDEEPNLPKIETEECPP